MPTPPIPIEVLTLALCKKYRCLPSDLDEQEAQDWITLVNVPDIEVRVKQEEDLKNNLYFRNKTDGRN